MTTAPWSRMTRAPDLIEDLFDGASPPLTSFRLAELRWEHGTKRLELRGTLSTFPSIRRPDWESDANRLAIRLALEDVRSYNVKGWDFESPIDLEVYHQQDENTLLVLGQNDSLTVEIVCDGIDVTEIFAYHSPELN